MNNTLEKRSMAFMNCPWKSTAGCNYIWDECFHSDPDGLRSLIDDFNRLGERLKTMEDKIADAHIIWKEREVREETYYNSGHLWEGEPFYFLKYVRYIDKIPYCSRCGKRIDDRFMHYCPNCGAKLNKEDKI